MSESKPIDFNNLPREMNAGITVIDKLNDKYLILVGSSIKYRKKQYSLFGGHYEKRDSNVLHTGIREFVEELFNFKISKEKIENIAKYLLNNKRLLDISMYIRDSAVFFINYKTLESIYNFLYHGTFEKKEKFNVHKFNKERIWHDRNIVGLNEVELVEGIYLNDLISENSRKFTKCVSNELYKQMSYIKN